MSRSWSGLNDNNWAVKIFGWFVALIWISAAIGFVVSLFTGK